eukprot:4839479-Prymnesium_polylepis.1
MKPCTCTCHSYSKYMHVHSHVHAHVSFIATHGPIDGQSPVLARAQIGARGGDVRGTSVLTPFNVGTASLDPAMGWVAYTHSEAGAGLGR